MLGDEVWLTGGVLVHPKDGLDPALCMRELLGFAMWNQIQTKT